MNSGFWQKLNKPIIACAPMANVTDVAFRKLFAKYGKPDVTWTEFVSADGLVHAPKEIIPSRNAGRDSNLSPHEILLKDLEYSEGERPIVAQLFSGKPENMKLAAKLVQDLGFDGLDINMGCPDKTIEKQKSGAALIKDQKLAGEIIQAAKDGAPNLPISVKTRIGYNQPFDSAQGKEEFENWISFLLKQELAALTIHWRTRKEMSKVPAHWELASKAIELRDKISPNTILLGNGDVKDLEDAYKKLEEYKLDGIMLGRAIFGNPHCFNPKIKREALDIKERLEIMLEHTKLFEELLPHKNFSVMKKHYKAYIEGFDGAKELRVKLMEASNSGEVEREVKEFLST